MAQIALLNQTRFHIVNYLLDHHCVSHFCLPLESVTQFVTVVFTLLLSAGLLNMTSSEVKGSVFTVFVIWWIAVSQVRMQPWVAWAGPVRPTLSGLFFRPACSPTPLWTFHLVP